jgi:hypothetical protein
MVVDLPLLRRATPPTFRLLSLNPVIKLLYRYEVDPKRLASLLVRPDAVVESGSDA